MLAYERHGSGEPLVLVHGVTHRRQAWYPVLERLTERHEVILVDLPGHGESPDLEAAGRPVADVLRDEFADFIAELGLERPHVAGNSLGGLVALHAGMNGHARSVTALSPAGFWRSDTEFAYSRQILARASKLAGRLGPRAEQLSRSRAGRKVMYGVLTSHPSRVSRDQALGDARAFRRARPALRTLLAAAEPFDGEIPLDVPVTVAWGARDLLLPPWQAEQARRVLPLAEHVTLRGVGHVPMTDDPELVANVLLQGCQPAATVAPIRGVRRSARRRSAASATA